MNIYNIAIATDENGNYATKGVMAIDFPAILKREKGARTKVLFDVVHAPYEYAWSNDLPEADFIPGGICVFLMSQRAKNILEPFLLEFGSFYECYIEGVVYFDFELWGGNRGFRHE